MDITRSVFWAHRVVAKLKPIKQIIPESTNSPNSYIRFKNLFVKFFADLDYSERKILTHLGVYNTIAYIYDKIEGDLYTVLPTEDAATANRLIETVTKFTTALGPYVKKAENPPPSAHIITIQFPISIKDNSTVELDDEVSWFFSVFNRSYLDLYKNTQKPILIGVDNVDVSISVEVGWEFMLIVATFTYAIAKLYAHNAKAKSAVDMLRDLGAKEETISQVQAEIGEADKASIEEILDQIGSVREMVTSGNIEPSILALYKRIREAKSKGYLFGFDNPVPDEKGSLPSHAPRDAISEIKRVTANERSMGGDSGAEPKAISSPDAKE